MHKALSLESGQEIPGLGLNPLPSRVQALLAYGRHLGAPRHRAFWGYCFLLLPSLCAKLKQCVVLACFIL